MNAEHDPRLVFKQACELWEFERIARLNYETFVEEIPQHDPNDQRKLHDRLLDRSTCFICLEGLELLGMVAIGERRPFSLDQKLPGLDRLLPRHRSACEIRLLAVRPERRRGAIFGGLLRQAARFVQRQGHDLVLISAAASQRALYEELGFVPFGPPLGSPFQGMYLRERDVTAPLRRVSRRPELRVSPTDADSRLPAPTYRFLPGPVEPSDAVRHELSLQPRSHRSAQFTSDLDELRRRLTASTGARGVDVLLGSGTLANDCVAARLAQRRDEGLLLVNGEFGERLEDHARRFGLAFEVVRAEWGQTFETAEIRERLGRRPRTGWLWAVHCETSTGVLNDLEALSGICRESGIDLCMDCISTVGAMPVDLSGVHLATAVSGKGFASIPGLALVFRDRELEPPRTEPTRPVPRSLDLSLYARKGGIPFTQSSNLVGALRRSVELTGEGLAERHHRREELARWLRGELEAAGWRFLARREISSPCVSTLVVEPGWSSWSIGEELERRGFVLHYRSSYLVERNLLQVCLMGDQDRGQIEALVAELAQIARRIEARAGRAVAATSG